MATVKIYVHSDFEGDYDSVIGAMDELANTFEKMVALNLGDPDKREAFRISVLHCYLKLGSELQRCASHDINDPTIILDEH